MVTTRSPDRTSLLSLPPEILTAILTELLPTSIDSVRSVLFVCRELYHVALPLSVHTFSAVVLTEGWGFHEVTARMQIQARAFLKYVTITKPFLARWVKRLTFDNFRTAEDSSDVKDEDKGEVTAEERQAYEKELHTVFESLNIDNPGRERWIKRILGKFVANTPEATIILLLAMCRGLEDFWYGEPYRPKMLCEFVHAAGEAARRAKNAGSSITSLPLSQLRSVYQESTENKYGYLGFAQQAAEYFTLPGLLSYECIMVNGADTDAESFDKVPRGSSTVEHIGLRNGCVSGPAIKAMLGAVAALRSYEYSHGIAHMYDGQMTAPAIMDAMLPHATTLASVDLHFDPDWQVGWDEPHDTYLGVRLKDMRALKTLKATAQLLMGILDTEPSYADEGVMMQVDEAPRLVACLPPDLEHLEIYDCGKAAVGQLQELLDAMSGTSGQFHRLRFVRFCFNEVSIQPEEITLSCTSPSARVEAVIQSDDQVEHDRNGSDRNVMNLCTRIYGDGHREQWLANIGSGTRVEICSPAEGT